MIYNDVPLVTSKLLDENGGRARADIAFPLTSILVVKLTQELAGSAAGLLTQLQSVPIRFRIIQARRDIGDFERAYI